MADSMLPLYAKAVLKALPLPGASRARMPERTIVRSVPIDADAYAGFTTVVEAGLGDIVHPGYLHVLAFPLSMQLLSDPGVPLPMMGMVHIRNRVDSLAPVRVGDVVDLHVRLDGPFEHDKGTTIDVLVEARVDGEPRMLETTTYLAKGRTLSGAKPGPVIDRQEFTAPQPTALWRLDPIVGTRYARASGDYNPIHLSSLAARGFGFPRVIAHGMYSASRALAAVDVRLERYRWDVAFAKPVLLPSTVGFAITAGRRHEESASAVFDPRRGRPHVLSEVSRLD
ncbi:MaoC dehydratase-like protein [Brevibacterium sanguinis]|uniref:MaoC dehydratase-like protein n=2 Tax=Brevibacterium TaxID=1696 RepID=A0A366IK67_9MICO|nr:MULTISPECIES: MaoC/PaaZ C-terminal domain-containing protein [Brevibacterium]RBP64677.1 MaoC dehydratase-like protein [Brevibacterium sanguinis]RBP71680.1 MaoC dehydratase-like protein [Brevibacterium celere]